MFTYIGPYVRVEGMERSVEPSLGIIMPTLKSVNGSFRFLSIFLYRTLTGFPETKIAYAHSAHPILLFFLEKGSNR